MVVEREDGLTHLDERGAAHMVDVGDKPVTRRRAVAEAFVGMQSATLDMIVEGESSKGDVIAAARIAGISAAKRTADLVPLCHPLFLTHVSVDLEPGDLFLTHVSVDLEPGDRGMRIEAVAETDGRTGVEMEALTAASVAALTLYDMCKAVDRGMTIERVRLLRKEGGRSGVWTRED